LFYVIIFLMIKFKILFISAVKIFIDSLPEEDRAKINCATDAMELNNFDSLYIKTLKTPIKELIIKKYRFVFFINKNDIWFVGSFIKKTTKTPKNEIENAKRLYKEIINLK
jgi:phage-related protein